MNSLALINEFLGQPPNASSHGYQIDHILEFCHWFMAALFVGWSAFFIYVLIRFRKSRQPRADHGGVRSHVSTHLEFSVVMIEAVLLLGFAIPLWARRVNQFPPGKEALLVHVVAQQFSFNYHLPGADGQFARRDVNLVSNSNPLGIDPKDPAGKDDIVTTGELHVPVDRPVIAELSSKDVIHDYFIPDMRIAGDAIPGSLIPIWFTPVKTGTYEVICAQLCGLGHYGMKGTLVVDTPQDYQAWLKERAELAGGAQPAAPSPSPGGQQPQPQNKPAAPAAIAEPRRIIAPSGPNGRFCEAPGIKTALLPRRPQGDGYKKSIREIGAIRGYLFQDELGNSGRSTTWLNRFAWITCIATLLLICSGGMVTSKNVGLAVPDWPTTFGYNMFLFPISKWVGGILFEHTHRLMGSLVGFLTIILAVWLWLREDRRWVRSLGVIAVVGVILQGILGGLRVTMMKDQIGIFHACVAQAFLGLLVFIALVTTKFWPSLANRHFDSQKFSPIKSLAIAITVAIYVQLALGATMRHQHRDLAILDFPTANGAWIPDTSAAALAKINAWRDARALSDVSAFQIWLQMVHRFLALIIAIAIVAFCARVWREMRDFAALKRLSLLWVVLIFGQIALGAWVIWSNKAADIATAHVALGAVMLSFGVSISAICWRISQTEVGRARPPGAPHSEPVPA